MVNRTSTFVAAGCVFFAVSLAPAQSGSAGDINSLNRGAGAGVVPRLVKFSGEINAQTIENSWSGKGANQAAAAISLTFSLYELQEGGSPLWWESQKVQLDDQGRYTVLLGANQSDGLPLDLFTSSRALWLGVQPQLPGAVEEPRVLLVAVPYALKASDADTLGGKPASAYALAGPALAAVFPGGSPPGSANQEPASDSRLATPDSRLLTPASQPQPAAACSAVTSDGTASANYLAKFTSACNIQRSLLFDNGTKVGVGTSAPVAFLDAQSTLTATSAGFNYGLRTLTTANPAAASSASFFSLFANAQTQAGNAQNFYNLYGMDFRTDHYGTGTVNGAYGGFGAVLNDAGGTINNAYGLYTYLSNASTGKINNAYGLYLGAPLNAGGGTFSNYTGVYIANPSAISGAYGLYSAGGTNYFGGKVGIGTATPAQALEVSGNVKLDGSGHGITYPDGSTQTTAALAGSGTVTKVSSGAGLTGGPITTTGTLSLASASCGAGQAAVALPLSCSPFATLGSNTFTAGQVINGGGLSATSDVDTNGNVTVDSGQVNSGNLRPGLLLGNIATGISSKQTSGGNQSGLDFWTGNADRMSITNFGSVGINTTNPYTLLHLVQSNSGGLGPSLTLMNSGGGAGSAASVDFDGYDPGISPPTVRIQSIDDGNSSSSLSFSTKAPGSASNGLVEQVRLVDYGSLIVDYSGNNALSFGTSSAAGTALIFGGITSGEGVASCRASTSTCSWVTPSGLTAVQSQYGLDFYTGYTKQMTIQNNGVIVVSNCTIWGNQDHQGSCPSDARLKTNVQPVPNLLDKLVQLEPVHFNWNPSNPPDYRFGSGRNTGLIAQQVEKVFPEMVTMDKNGFRTLNGGQLPYMLLQGVRELKARNDSLRAEAEGQRKQIEQARAEIANLRQTAAAAGARMARLDRSSAAKDAQIATMSREIEQLRQAQQQMAVLLAHLSPSPAGTGKPQLSDDSSRVPKRRPIPVRGVSPGETNGR